MKIILVLCVFMVALPAFAGTFKDNFDDGNLDGWVKSGNGSWEVLDGRCKISLFPGGPCSLMMIGEPDWKDYTVEIEMQSNQAFDYIGFRVRVQDFDNGYPWVVCVTDNTVRWYTQINNNFTVITSDKTQGDLIREKHTLKAVIKGNEFEGYYDGKLIRVAIFDHFKTGKVTIGICGSGPSSAFFDNVIITGDKVPDNSKSVESKGKLAAIWGEIRRGK
ncbi:MAG: hypothetical protein AAB116_02140 [Candidatus Poribacteria bacterium]